MPLLAIRQLLVFDLLFLLGAENHVHQYLRRFAPTIPARVRAQLVGRLATRALSA
nr:hypothetical protein [Saccharopolyspora shandongensis]